MARKKANPLVIIVVGVLLAAAWVWVSDDNITMDEDTTEEATVNLFATGLVSRTYDSKGQLTRIIRAPALSKPSTREEVTVFAPRVEIYNNQRQTASITASNARIFTPYNLIQLNGDVALRQLNNTRSVLWTSQLLYNYQTKYAFTDEPVTMRDLHGKLQATGMDIDVTREIVTFRSDVEAEYETPAQ